MSDLVEIRDFIEALREIKVSDDGPYKRLDRYRDFHAVFSTPEGRRVLSQIMDRCDTLIDETEAGDAAKMIWRAAQRNIGMWITATATTPPRAVTQEKRPPVR